MMWKYYEALGTAENHPRRSSLIISWLDQGRWLKLFRKGYGGIWRDMQDKCLKIWMWVGQKWEEMISSCFPTMKKRQYFAPVQKRERLNRANILLRGLKAGTAEQEIVFFFLMMNSSQFKLLLTILITAQNLQQSLMSPWVYGRQKLFSLIM